MDIRCPSCETLYGFDDSQVKRKAFSVKCSTCAHIFRVELTPDASALEIAAPPDDAASQRRWMLRPANGGPTRDFDDMTTLQTWIMEQRVQPSDAISKTGAVWKTLDSIPELASLFEVAQKLAAPAPTAPTPQAEFFDPDAPGTPVTAPPEPDPAPTSDADDALNDPLAVDLSAELGPIQPLTLGGFTPSPELDGVHLDTTASQTSSSPTAAIVAVLIVALITAAGLYAYTAHPELLGLAPPADTTAEASPDAGVSAAATPDASAQAPEGDADAAAQSPSAKDNPKDDPKDGAKDDPKDDAKAGAKDDPKASAKDAPKTAPKPPKASADAKKRDPNAGLGGSYDALIRRAYQFRQQGRMDRAAQAFKMAVAKRPNSSEAHAGLGWAYFGMGSASQASKSFQKAIQINPRYANAHFGLGRAYQAMGQSGKAIECFRKYLRISPSGPSAATARKLITSLGGTPPP